MSFDRLKPAFHAVPGCALVLRFDDEGRAEPGDADDIAHIGAPGEGFVWLHLHLDDPNVDAMLKRLSVLNDDARKTLSGPIDRQFVEHSGGIVRGAFFDRERGGDGAAATGTDYLRFAFGEQFLVSARQRPLRAVESTLIALGAGRLASSPLELFEAIVGHLCDELGRMIFELSSTLDRIEERIVMGGQGLDERATLGPTRRAALRLAREVGGLRSPLLRLEASVSDPEQDDLREAGARLARRADILAHDLSEMQDRARLLQDELSAIDSSVTNDRLYILTMVTTLLLPATFVTGFFGMNTKNLPFTETTGGTAYAAALCVGASLVVLFFMRRLGLTRPRGAIGARKPPPKV